MRAVECSELGSPEVLRVVERDDLEAGPGQVVVDVHVAGVNYVDALFVSGEYQIKPQLPFVPGSEIAGVVRSVGKGVDGVAIGDRVLAMCGLGGYAEQVTLAPMQCVALPDNLDLARAATFVQSYCTALFALRERAGATAGESLLVLGAGGGVGQAVVDVGRALGLRVMGAASTDEKRAAATAMGAERVVDPAGLDIKADARSWAGGTGVDIVVDPVGGDLADAALRALGYKGRYLVIGFAAGTIPALPLNQVLLRNRSILGVDWGAWSMQFPLEHLALLGELLAMVERGQLHPPAPTTYPLERVADALGDLLGRRAVGKIALSTALGNRQT